MRAVVIRAIGWTPDVDDVVQDAMLSAIRALDELREPLAVGSWLQKIALNTSRMRLRTRPAATPTVLADRLADPKPSPEQILESHALRDWIWSSLDELSEALQQVVLLRYFSSAHSYSEIAAMCGVPIGTVRSRLNQARARLAKTMRDNAERSHRGASTLTAEREQVAVQLLSSASHGSFASALADIASPGVHIVSPDGAHERGRKRLETIMESDLQAGVEQKLTQVVAGSHLTIWECDLQSPPWDPSHCPPAVLWMLTHQGTQVDEIRLFHPVTTAM